MAQTASIANTFQDVCVRRIALKKRKKNYTFSPATVSNSLYLWKKWKQNHDILRDWVLKDCGCKGSPINFSSQL